MEEVLNFMALSLTITLRTELINCQAQLKLCSAWKS